MEIVSEANRPQRDQAMIEAAGIKLDRALFSVLVMIERLGPIGVVDLADRLGRDYTTVSRQAAKLSELGLVSRATDATDKRVRAAVITTEGKAMTDRIDATRERLGRVIFDTWNDQDIDDFVRLTRRFADALRGLPRGPN
jgi:DNA-binding MarR family transcriptional regulator